MQGFLSQNFKCAPDLKKLVTGVVAIKHCNPALKKHVFPKFLNAKTSFYGGGYLLATIKLSIS
jgi:hypothetical protein